jgi:large subunit ribosomal protein L35
MPKNKTHSGIKKRVKLTANGKVKRRRAFSSHLMTKKTSKRKRKFRKDVIMASADVPRVKDLLGE